MTTSPAGTDDHDTATCEQDQFEQCHAIVEQAAWSRPDNSSQCGRSGIARPELAGAVLCWQHEQKAQDGSEVWLIGQRLLIANVEYFENGRRTYRDARILERVVSLDHVVRDTPPSWWKPVTEEDLREAVERLGALYFPSTEGKA